MVEFFRASASLATKKAMS